MSIRNNKELFVKEDENAVFSTTTLQVGMRYEVLKKYDVIYIGFEDFVDWKSSNNGFFTTVYQEDINPVHVFYNEKDNLFEIVKIGTITKELGLVSLKKIEWLKSLYKRNKLSINCYNYLEIDEDKRPNKLVQNSYCLAPIIRSMIKKVGDDWFFSVYKTAMDDKINYVIFKVNKNEDTKLLSFDIVYPEHWEIYKDIIDLKNIRKLEVTISKLIQRESGFMNKVMLFFNGSKKGQLPKKLKICGFKYLKIKD